MKLPSGIRTDEVIKGQTPESSAASKTCSANSITVPGDVYPNASLYVEFAYIYVKRKKGELLQGPGVIVIDADSLSSTEETGGSVRGVIESRVR